jgi:hypothetical protein
MTHADIVTRGNVLFDRAVAAHPADRVKQALYVTQADGTIDAYDRAVSDCAFNRVFNTMDEAEAQVWAIHCLYATQPLAGAMRGKHVKLPTDLRAAA